MTEAIDLGGITKITSNSHSVSWSSTSGLFCTSLPLRQKAHQGKECGRNSLSLFVPQFQPAFLPVKDRRSCASYPRPAAPAPSAALVWSHPRRPAPWTPPASPCPRRPPPRRCSRRARPSAARPWCTEWRSCGRWVVAHHRLSPLDEVLGNASADVDQKPSKTFYAMIWPGRNGQGS
jgi:hypothetical protein